MIRLENVTSVNPELFTQSSETYGPIDYSVFPINNIPTIAVLDTGVYTEHYDFRNGNIIAELNYVRATQYSKEDNSHGTHICGSISADTSWNPHTKYYGALPGSNIIMYKVLSNSEEDYDWLNIKQALQDIISNPVFAIRGKKYEIRTICLPFTDGRNYYSDEIDIAFQDIKKLLEQLVSLNISVIAAAGNNFLNNGCQIGLGIPAIFNKCISAGSQIGSQRKAGQVALTHSSGAVNYNLSDNDIAAFSQRYPGFCQDIDDPDWPHIIGKEKHFIFFTKNGQNLSTGNQTQNDVSWMTGTSASAAFLTAKVHRFQCKYSIKNGFTYPSFNEIIKYLISKSTLIEDFFYGQDNVMHPYHNQYFSITF